MRLAALTLALLSLSAQAAPPAPTCPRDAKVTLHAWFDLPRDDERSRGLSGLTWDRDAGVLLAVSDRRPAILTLRPDARFARFAFGDSLPVDVGKRWDAEAITLAGDRIFLGNEAGPWVHILDRRGKLTGELPLPASFGRARHNAGLESLTASPDGKLVFVMNEHAFEGDGGMGDAKLGTSLRLTRIELASGSSSQRVYVTDPVFSASPKGRIGVSEMAALSPSRLLVLERAFVPGEGNAVRIYCVDLGRAGDPVEKILILDLDHLSDAGFPEPLQPQRGRLLENYEGLAAGPTLPDGRRLLFLVSDDNVSPRQIARILVLAASGL